MPSLGRFPAHPWCRKGRGHCITGCPLRFSPLVTNQTVCVCVWLRMQIGWTGHAPFWRPPQTLSPCSVSSPVEERLAQWHHSRPRIWTALHRKSFPRALATRRERRWLFSPLMSGTSVVKKPWRNVFSIRWCLDVGRAEINIRCLKLNSSSIPSSTSLCVCVSLQMIFYFLPAPRGTNCTYLGTCNWITK